MWPAGRTYVHARLMTLTANANARLRHNVASFITCLSRYFPESVCTPTYVVGYSLSSFIIYLLLMSVKYIEPCSGVPVSRLQELLHILQEMEDNQYLALNDLIPNEPRQKYEFIQCLERNGLSAPIMLLTYSSGNNVGNLLCLENAI